MNKSFFIISIFIYILNGIITCVFDINAHNTLWSGVFFLVLLIPLCIGCVVNSSIYNKKNSALRFLFYYFSFMCSFGILLIAILSPIILRNTKNCLIILLIFALLSLISLIGYFIQRKHGYRNKRIFGYFTILFFLALIIDLILTVIFRI